MSLSTSVHVHAEAEFSTHRLDRRADAGYLRIRPNPDHSLYLSASIHSDAAGFRRLAAAALALADELTKETTTP